MSEEADETNGARIREICGPQFRDEGAARPVEQGDRIQIEEIRPWMTNRDLAFYLMLFYTSLFMHNIEP